MTEVPEYEDLYNLRLVNDKPLATAPPPQPPPPPRLFSRKMSSQSSVESEGSIQASSQSNPIFKVHLLEKDDRKRRMLVFVISANVVQYIVRGKKPIEIPFDEIFQYDVCEGQITITTTTEQTYQLGLSDLSEEEKVRKCLSSIGQQEDLSFVEEDVLIEGYLDKKVPRTLGGTQKRFVKVTQGKLSYYKMDSSKSYEAPLNTIMLNLEMNEIKLFGNDGFTIAPKVRDGKDGKEFSFMIQKGKLKVDDIIKKRVQWVAAIMQAYEVGTLPSPSPSLSNIRKSSQSSTTSNRHDSISSIYEELEMRPFKEDQSISVPQTKPGNKKGTLCSPPPVVPDLPDPPPYLLEEPLYADTPEEPVYADTPEEPVYADTPEEPLYADLELLPPPVRESPAPKLNVTPKPPAPKPTVAPKPPVRKSPGAPIPPCAPKPPRAPKPPGAPNPPGVPKPPGAPGPPSPSIVAKVVTEVQPQVVPKVKVLPLHWQKVPPTSLKKSVWGELVDVSPMIDVVKLEEYFAINESVKKIRKPSNTQEKKSYLDSQRSQNIGIFLYSASIEPESIGELVARINQGEENINALKKFSPTAEDIEIFGKIPESSVSSLSKAEKLMWYMVNTPCFTQRLNIIEMTISIPDDIEYIKRMVDNILEVCRVLLNSNSFLRFLEKILTIGNMMNAAIKKTTPGFKLSSTLPKLATIKSQDKTVSLLDFIVQQAVLLDGDCLKFVNELEIVHIASSSSSIVSLSAEVDIMKQDINKLPGRASDISKKYPPDDHMRTELEQFVDDVNSFVKSYQQNVFLLNEQSTRMKSDYSKVMERFGESPKTDSEEFMKMLSEFQTSLVESIKRCPHPLPQCVAHLKPKPPAAKPPPSPTGNRPMMAQMDLANSLENSSLFKRNTQNDLKIPT